MADGYRKFKANSAMLFGASVKKFCLLTSRLSLEALTKLAEEADQEAKVGGMAAGVVCVKVRRGRGQASPPLLVMTFDMFKRLRDQLTSGRRDDGISGNKSGSQE